MTEPKACPPPAAPPKPSPTPSLQQILASESALSAVEIAIRHQQPNAPLESLADAYLTRLAGHRLDNVDRAILTYRLATRLPSPDASAPSLLRARVLAKLGNAWFTRLHVRLRTRGAICSAADTRAHLIRALRPLNDAVAAFDARRHWRRERQHSAAYLHAMLCRGLVYDSLYQTIDVHTEPASPRRPVAPTASSLLPPPAREARVEEEPLKKKVRRRMYVNDCISSLEAALAGGAPLDDGDEAVEAAHERLRDHNKAVVAREPHAESLRGVKRAHAVMCLARAYSNVEDDHEAANTKALQLLESVEDILRTRHRNVKEDEVQYGWPVEYGWQTEYGEEAEIAQMLEDARAQISALSAGERGSASRCLVC